MTVSPSMFKWEWLTPELVYQWFEPFNTGVWYNDRVLAQSMLISIFGVETLDIQIRDNALQYPDCPTRGGKA